MNSRIKDALYKDSYFESAPPTFLPPLEPLDQWLGGRATRFLAQLAQDFPTGRNCRLTRYPSPKKPKP